MIKNALNVIKDKFYFVLFELKTWDWNLILLGIISVQLATIIFFKLHFYTNNIVIKDSLELILTINGLFSAILVTYFFNRVSRVLDSNKENYNDAINYSQKITEFRRICKTFTDYYGVWENDDSTKRLIQHGKYKNVDYFDFKLSSFSDYVPSDKKTINEFYNDPRYQEGLSDLFLAMISLVENRKSHFRMPSGPELYKHFQTKGVYNFQFISNCVEIDYASRMGYWFEKNYQLIKYQNLSRDSKKYILDSLERIDSKYKNAELNNKTMAEICDDMNEHYFKVLYNLLLRLRKGLSSFNMLIYGILILSLTFGVLFPFLTYFFFEGNLKILLTKMLIGVNFGLLLFFIVGLYRLVKKEITWT